VTTEGGLDLLGHGDESGPVAKHLADNGISGSVFIDPDPRQIERLSQIRGDLTLGFELNTDSYSTARGAGRDTELAKIIEVAELGMENGLLVYAGHGLNTDNVGPVSAIPQIEELNIGHAIVSRAVLIGMEAAVSEMLTAMATKGTGPGTDRLAFDFQRLPPHLFRLPQDDGGLRDGQEDSVHLFTELAIDLVEPELGHVEKGALGPLHPQQRIVNKDLGW
jgi:hypothetical protein